MGQWIVYQNRERIFTITSKQMWLLWKYNVLGFRFSSTFLRKSCVWNRNVDSHLDNRSANRLRGLSRTPWDALAFNALVPGLHRSLLETATYFRYRHYTYPVVPCTLKLEFGVNRNRLPWKCFTYSVLFHSGLILQAFHKSLNSKGFQNPKLFLSWHGY